MLYALPSPGLSGTMRVENTMQLDQTHSPKLTESQLAVHLLPAPVAVPSPLVDTRSDLVAIRPGDVDQVVELLGLRCGA